MVIVATVERMLRRIELEREKRVAGGVCGEGQFWLIAHLANSIDELHSFYLFLFSGDYSVICLQPKGDGECNVISTNHWTNSFQSTF